MKLFDYSELIRVIDNVEIREEREKTMKLIDMAEKCRKLERELIESGILNDWNRFKQLCAKANVRLCVSHQGSNSMGCVINHPEKFQYCQEYKDNGTFVKCMSSGSYWSDYFGFIYKDEKIVWQISHTTGKHSFEGFGTNDVEKEYLTKIYLLETFKNTYEDYRNFQLQKIKEKFGSRITTEDIIKEG